MIAPDVTTIDYDALNAMRGAGGVEPIWLPNPWLAGGGKVLNIGCGARPVVGAVNHDRRIHSPWVDIAWELEAMPWAHGWQDDAPRFDVVVAHDVIEHIPDALGFVNEVHALLRPGGLFIMRGGAADNPAAYTDPTHVHYFTEESFDFFDRSTGLGNHYGRFYVDRLGRPLTEWRIDGVDRVNPDYRYPDTPDLCWTMVRS